MKNFLVEGIKDRIKALEEVKALLLLVSNLFARLWGLKNLSCSILKLSKDCYKSFIKHEILELF